VQRSDCLGSCPHKLNDQRKLGPKAEDESPNFSALSFKCFQNILVLFRVSIYPIQHCLSGCNTRQDFVPFIPSLKRSYPLESEFKIGLGKKVSLFRYLPTYTIPNAEQLLHFHFTWAISTDVFNSNYQKQPVKKLYLAFPH
jgi:hypothetical protein